MLHGCMKALPLNAADPPLQVTEAPLFEHQVVYPPCHDLLQQTKDLGAAAIHHAAQGKDKRVEREIVARAVSDLVVGNHAEVFVDEPGRVVVLLREGWWIRVFVVDGHNRKIMLGVGRPYSVELEQDENLDVLCRLV